MIKIEAYKTSDGEIFTTLEDAHKHEFLTKWADLIEEFTQSPYCTYKNKMGLAVVKKSIKQWEQFRAAKDNAEVDK